MDVEKTIQFLVENAAAHDVRLNRLERAVLRLTENQTFLQSALKETQKAVQDTQKSLRALGERTDERIAKLVRAITVLSKQRSNGSKA